MRLSNIPFAVSWALQLIVAGILLQTLFFKFTGAAESVYIFSTLGAEPWGRIGSGVVELIAALLLLYPATITIGALLALGAIMGAIVSHLTVLGIEVQGDGGLLFVLAVVVFVSSTAILFLRRGETPSSARGWPVTRWPRAVIPRRSSSCGTRPCSHS
jgi:putative oxidoreductase